MAKNTGQGYRSGTPSERSYLNPLTAMWTKPNSSSGKFMCQPRTTPPRLRDRLRTWLRGESADA